MTVPGAGVCGLLDASIFDYNSEFIRFRALAAFVTEGGKDALESIIMGGTMHDWAAVREEAVLTAERICGKQ